MKLSTKGRYATRIMARLAWLGNGEPVKKQAIASAEGISPDYVEQILMRLVCAGLVRSRRGPKGGFLLAREPRDITVGEVLVATEGSMCLVPCLEEDCSRASSCATRPLWKKVQDAVQEIIDNTTVEELAAEARNNSQNEWTI